LKQHQFSNLLRSTPTQTTKQNLCSDPSNLTLKNSSPILPRFLPMTLPIEDNASHAFETSILTPLLNTKEYARRSSSKRETPSTVLNNASASQQKAD
jgi:hypothetical protein